MQMSLAALMLAFGVGPVDPQPAPQADVWGPVRKLGKADGNVFAVSPDGSEIAIHPYNRATTILDLRSGKVRRIDGKFGSHFGAIAYSPDGKRIACAEWNNGATIRDAKTWEILHHITPSGGHPVSTAAFTPDGKRVAFYCWTYRGGFPPTDFTTPVTHHDYQLMLWDVEKKKELGWPAAARVELPGVHFHESTFRDRPFLFIREDRSDAKGYAASKTFSMTDITTNKTTKKIELHKDDDKLFDVTPDGKQILVMTAGQDPRLVDVETGKSGRSFGGHARLVTAAALSRDGKLVLTASGRRVDGYTAAKLPAWPPDVGPTELRIHNIATGEVVAAYQNDTLLDFAFVGFSPDGKYVWAQDWDRELILWGKFPAMPAGVKVNWPVDPQPPTSFQPGGGPLTRPASPFDLPVSDALEKLIEELPKSGRPVAQQIDALFLAILGRFPTAAEAKRIKEMVGDKPTAEKWRLTLAGLVATPEFDAHVKTLEKRLPITTPVPGGPKGPPLPPFPNFGGGQPSIPPGLSGFPPINPATGLPVGTPPLIELPKKP